MLTRSEILKILRNLNAGRSALHDLRGQDFEAIVAFLLESRNCPVKRWVRTGDEHLEILATTHIHVGAVDAVIQCKRYSSDQPVDVEAARALLRSLSNHGADLGVLVTTSYFPHRTIEFCESAGPLLTSSMPKISSLGYVKHSRGKKREQPSLPLESTNSC